MQIRGGDSYSVPPSESNKLKQKYASSVNAPISEVIEYAENAKTQLETLSLSEEHIQALQTEIVALEKQVYAVAKNLSEKRKIGAVTMANAVVDVLYHLGMKDTQFTVLVDTKPGDTDAQKCGPYGIDDIEFIFSANVGSSLKPLAKIASGGELSRVMLALKTVLCSSEKGDTTETLIFDEIDTGIGADKLEFLFSANLGIELKPLNKIISGGEMSRFMLAFKSLQNQNLNKTCIFDEIDTGIGGEVAVSVGQHIKELAKNHQIFCITHLASIASFAATQIKIEKAVKDSVTTTSVRELTDEERVSEIARMLSGDVLNEASLEHARILLKK